MKIATVLFTYNRPWHTKQVIQGLSGNNILPEKLFIFQDGLNVDSKKDEWIAVKEIIHNVDFCPVEVIESFTNKGLANSIVDGINYVLEEFDAVIVLEDDCVPAPGFMAFMVQALEQYKERERVYSISGYSWPIELEKDKYDAYFTGRESTWGWGTWKDRWLQYEKDYTIYKKLKFSKEGSYNLALWGADIEPVVIGNVIGQMDSWGLFWGLKIIEKEGRCLAPYKSLISNIGNDGTGVHCGSTNKFDVEIDLSGRVKYSLPESLEIRKETERSFTSLFGSYTAANNNFEKEKVIVYGLGNLFYLYEKEINDDYYISSFFDCYRKGFYAGKKIMKTKKELDQVEYSKIILMMKNVTDCFEICTWLINDYKINPNIIEIGICKYGEYKNRISSIVIQNNGNWIINKSDKNAVIVKNENEFIHEIEG